MALCVDILRSFGFTDKDLVVRISDREVWTDFLREKKVPAEQWPQILQAIDKSEREPRERTAAKLGALAEPIFGVFDHGGKSEKLEEVMRGLRVRGLDRFVEIDVQIVRGLAYYTGIVFEVFDRAGKLRAIAGGGRYDTLIHQLSDAAVSLPALGFAMGDVVLGELIGEIPEARSRMEAALQTERALDVYVVVAKEERRPEALEQVQRLREHKLRVDYPLVPAKVGKQFQAAEQLGARLAVLIGDEWPNIAVKDLRTGEQQLVAKDQLLERVASALK